MSRGRRRERCELEVCASVTIRSRADLEASRRCAEIRGDLTISSAGLSEIGADDFPFLTTIAGDLTIGGAYAADGPQLQSVTLANLRSVGGAVMVMGVTVIEFGASGPLRELHLPALASIGQRDALGLAVFQADLRALDLRSLKTIGGSVVLDTLVALCTLNVESVEEIAGGLAVHYLPMLSPWQLAPLRSAAAQVSEQLLGCCEANPEERVACEGFPDSARSLYCGACE